MPDEHAADPNTDPNAGDTKGKGKVTFDALQQAKVNELINDAFGRGFSRATGELNDKFEHTTNTLTAQIEELRKATDAKPAPKVEEKKVDDKVTDSETEAKLKLLQAQLDELKSKNGTLAENNGKLLGDLEAERKHQEKASIKDEFYRAASDLNFLSVADVFKLVEDDVQFDKASGRTVVMNQAKGVPLLNGDAEPVSLAEHLKSFAADRPWMVRADSAGGHGSAETRKTDTTKKSALANVDTLPPAEFEALRGQVMAGKRIE